MCTFQRIQEMSTLYLSVLTHRIRRNNRCVKNIAPGFDGINLEDISAPRCFEIEERLKEILDTRYSMMISMVLQSLFSPV